MSGLYVAGAGLWLPPAMTLTEAEARGDRVGPLAHGTGFTSVCVSAGDAPPEMAVRAASAALEQSGREPEDVGLLLHACAYHQGHDMWTPASYIQRLALGNRCPALEVRQMSNGGMAAVELAAAHLAADPSRDAVLVTTADRFCPPGFDRWNSDPGTLCGDAGTALVLSRRGGWARVRSLVTVSDPGLERGCRGDAPFSTAPLSADGPIDLSGNTAALTRRMGVEKLVRRIERGQREAFELATGRAGVELRGIDRFILPNLGRSRMKAHFYNPFGIDPERTTWEWGRTVGHLGAGDQIAGLAHAARRGLLATGDLCLLAGIGAGFTWTVAVLEIVGAVG